MHHLRPRERQMLVGWRLVDDSKVSYPSPTLGTMTTALAIVTVALSAIAVIASTWTGTLNKRSTITTEASSASAGRSAEAAEASAGYSRTSANSAERVARAAVTREAEEQVTA